MSEVVTRRGWISALWIPLAAAILVASPLRAQGTAAQIALGDSLFNGRQFGACWSCHGKQAKGTSTAPTLVKKEWLNIDGSMEAIKGVIHNGIPKPKKAKVPMPAMGGAKLTDEQIDGLAAYVYSLNHPGGK